MTSWVRSAGEEFACRILDPIEIFTEVLANFVEAIEDDALGLDRIRYGLEKILVRLRLAAGKTKISRVSDVARITDTPCTWKLSP